ncbi:DUF4224 domain-containing protein [Collimonas pratensis]|uniref:DUF4224 domain-containing protein n=1 Tax=Collimonas pratensis TaxID=279113 RepID=UPI0009EF2AB3|nr:DUF4224 domain-containing protein [Collimonas pratensis]
MTEQSAQIFLTEAQVDELTGIRRGVHGVSKYVKQCAFLRGKGIAFWDNARGRPIVPLAAIEGRKVETPRKTWEPKITGTNSGAN